MPYLTWLSHQRRRKRKQKRLNRNSKPNVDKTLNGVGFNHHLFSTNNVTNTTSRNHTTAASELPRFENTRPDDDEDLKSEISSNEDKNILSSVRFSRLVDSRRISKDYYALLQKEQEKYAPHLYIECFLFIQRTMFVYFNIYNFNFFFQFKAKIKRPIWKAE